MVSAMTYGALFSTRLVAEGDFHGALAKAAQEIAADPDDPEAHFNQGQAHAGLGQYDESVAAYSRALAMDAGQSALDPAVVDDELFDVLRTWSLALAQTADRATAIATLERYRSLVPDGRHVDDVAKWTAHINGVEAVWYRDRV